MKFLDLDGSGAIDGQDRTKLGSAIPNFTYGLSLGLDFKGFDFKIFFQGVQGNSIVNSLTYFTMNSNVVESNVLRDMINSWTLENNSDIPRVVNGDPNKNYRFSDRYVENGSFLRIRNLQFGYTIPSRLTEKFRVRDFRVYFSVDNLHTWTKYSGYDPEISGYGYYAADRAQNDYSPMQSGIDRANYPVTRKFTIGVNLKF